jgi:hypothetical protein
VALGDFIRGFFNRKRNPELTGLESFVAGHKGVEGYIEPQTATQPTTLLLVDRDGASARAAVRQRDDAISFCERWSIPVYDAAVVGYPRRMLDRDRNRRSDATARLDDEIAELERRLEDPGPPPRDG